MHYTPFAHKNSMARLAAALYLVATPCSGEFGDALPPEVEFAGNLLVNPSFEESPPPSECGIDAVVAGTFTCGGGIVYDVAVPDPGTHSAPWGLILNIHGGSMSGAYVATIFHCLPPAS